MTPRRVAGAVAIVSVAIAAGFLATRSPAPQSLAFYRVGRATVTIDGGAPVQLVLVEPGATIFSSIGAGLAWTSAEGWYLNLNGPTGLTGLPVTPVVPASDPIEARGSLQRDGDDFRGWAGIDSKACAIVYVEVGLTRIAGTAHCRGVMWYSKASIENTQPLDLPPFDLQVDFEATGDGTFPQAIGRPPVVQAGRR